MEAELSKNLEKTVDRALRHLKSAGFDDVFKPPIFSTSIETTILSRDVESIDKHLKSEAIKFVRCRDFNKCSIGKPREHFVPKDRFTFRRMAWLDPIDAIKFTSLVLLIADKIEAARVPVEKNIVHSHRVSELSDTLFEKDYGYASFRAASKAKSRYYVGGFKLLTDISNFFDRVNLHALENILIEIGCDSNVVKFLNETLLHFSARNSFGLPVGCDASRVLSEASLINVDRHLMRVGIDFITYVDDYRVFAKSRMEIQSSLLTLAKSLHDEGLFINFSKTNLVQVNSEMAEPEIHDQTGHMTAHKSIDESEKIVAVRVLGNRSGRSVISKHYKKPGAEAINLLREMNKLTLIQSLSTTSGGEQERTIRDICKYFIYVESDVQLIAAILKEKVTSIFYLSDCLVKDGDRLAPEIRKTVVEHILEEMSLEFCPYPYILPVVKVISSSLFLRQDLLIDILDRSSSSESTIFFREIILLMSRYIPRPRLRSLCRDNFSTRPVEIQRALMHIVQTTELLARGEKEPIIKDMLNSSRDLFLHNM